MKKLTSIFTNFVYEEYCNFDLCEIENFCKKEIEKNSSSLSRSNVGGFHSKDYTENTIKNTPFEKLNKKINIAIDELCEHFELNSKVKLDNLWFIVNKKYNYNLPHTHPFCAFSGAFYVKAPENCGKVFFKNPNISLTHHIFDDRIEKFNHFNSTTWWIEPEPNKLIIFPSWLEHWVMPNLSEDDRIVLSFNYRWYDSNGFIQYA